MLYLDKKKMVQIRNTLGFSNALLEDLGQLRIYKQIGELGEILSLIQDKQTHFNISISNNHCSSKEIVKRINHVICTVNQFFR